MKTNAAYVKKPAEHLFTTNPDKNSNGNSNQLTLDKQIEVFATLLIDHILNVPNDQTATNGATK